jgi:hypothetical protein
MIPRKIGPVLRRLAGQYPVVTVTGPRQSGKKAFSSLLGSQPRMQALVYGGTEAQRQTDVSAWPAWGVADLLEEADRGSRQGERAECPPCGSGG